MTAHAVPLLSRSTFASYRDLTKPEASSYVCHASLLQREFQDLIKDVKLEVHCWIVLAEEHLRLGLWTNHKSVAL